MPAKINYSALKLAIEKPVERAFRQAAIRMADEKFDEAKQKFLDGFITDPISEEIDEGPESTGGILIAEGNLFSFLGFDAGSTPVKDLSEFLDDHTYIRNLNRPTYDKVRQRYLFDVMAPSKQDIKNETKIDRKGWNISWVYEIETGISNLTHFLAARDRPMGESGGGIQSKGIVNPRVQFRKRDYLSKYLDQFVRDLK